MMVRWINVRNRLPEDGLDVPIILDGLLATGRHYKNGMALDDYNLFKKCPTWEVGLDAQTYSLDAYECITHWLEGVILPGEEE